MTKRLVDTYRPVGLVDVVGQPDIVRGLQVYLEAPYSGGFLFHGPTGVGKTSVALALAAELGVALEHKEFGGLHRIPAGEQTGEAVRELRKNLGYYPWEGSGWKVALIDEADYVSRAAAQVWLDVLERLPEKTLVIFTTNEPGKLPQRFRDRCEAFSFDGGPLTMGPPVQALVGRIWRDVGGSLFGEAPRWEDLADTDDRGDLSVRRVLQGLEDHIRQVYSKDKVDDLGSMTI